MPHIVIKTISGPSQNQLQEAAEQIAAVVNKTIYLAAVSLWAIGLTLYDKYAAQRGLWRVKERTLLLVSLLGGSAAMLASMRIIRHKTKHAKFMIGIPVIIIFQAAAVLFAWWRLKGGVL